MKRFIFPFLFLLVTTVALGWQRSAHAELRYFLHVRTQDGASGGYNYTSDSYAFNPQLDYYGSNLKLSVTSKAAGTERFDLELTGRTRWTTNLLTPGRYSVEYVNPSDTSTYTTAVVINLGARNCLSTERTFDDVTIHSYVADTRYANTRLRAARIDFSKGCGVARGQKARTFTIGSFYAYEVYDSTPGGQFQVEISELDANNFLSRKLYSDRVSSQEFDVRMTTKPYELQFNSTTPNSDGSDKILSVTSLRNNQQVEVTEGSFEEFEGSTPSGNGLKVTAQYSTTCPSGTVIARTRITNLTKGLDLPSILPNFYWMKTARLEATRHCVIGDLTKPGEVLGSPPPVLMSFAVAYLADVPESWTELKYQLDDMITENTALKAQMEENNRNYVAAVKEFQGSLKATQAAVRRAELAEAKLAQSTSVRNAAINPLRSISKSYCGKRAACQQAVNRVITALKVP